MSLRILQKFSRLLKKSLPGWFFEKTQSVLGRPKTVARLSAILAFNPGCENRLRDAFLKTIPPGVFQQPANDCCKTVSLLAGARAMGMRKASRSRAAPCGGSNLGEARERDGLRNSPNRTRLFESPSRERRPQERFFATVRGAGFSLLEVLVAIAILSFIMMATYQVTSQTIQAKKRLGKMSEAYHAARSSMDRMVQDLSMAFLLEGKPHLGQKQGSEQLKTIFKGDDSGLAFASLSHLRLFQNARESDQAEIGYKLERDEENRDAYVLMRREQAPPDKNSEEGGLWLPFASGVKKWKLEFYSAKQNDWQSSWNTASEPEPRLPRAVRITMTFQHPLHEEKELTFTTVAMVGLHVSPINF